MWWLDTSISEDQAVFIFRIEVDGDRKVDVEVGRV
jgi:hypothetical protein